MNEVKWFDVFFCYMLLYLLVIKKQPEKFFGLLGSKDL